MTISTSGRVCCYIFFSLQNNGGFDEHSSTEQFLYLLGHLLAISYLCVWGVQLAVGWCRSTPRNPPHGWPFFSKNHVLPLLILEMSFFPSLSARFAFYALWKGDLIFFAKTCIVFFLCVFISPEKHKLASTVIFALGGWPVDVILMSA